MSAKTYDSKEVLIVAGGFLLSGYADGQFFSLVPNADEYELTMGSDGEGTRSAQNNKSAQMTISLLQSSSSNAILEAFAQSGETFPMLVKDNSGASIYSMVTAWVRRRPDTVYDRTAVNRDWILETDNYVGGEAGN